MDVQQRKHCRISQDKQVMLSLFMIIDLFGNAKKGLTKDMERDILKNGQKMNIMKKQRNETTVISNKS